LFIPTGLFAYEPNSTHDALTHESVNFYNVFANEYGTPALSSAERTLIQKGAMDEDNNYRMAHHFYDPTYDRGLKFYMSSKTWAQSPAYQASWRNGPGGCMIQPHLVFPLYESPCDYSWQRAIYDYSHGDTAMKSRALEALGHTLHLIEDASVPDHTRDDAHIPIFDNALQQFDSDFSEKSPFEAFTNQFSLANNNVHTAQELDDELSSPYFYFTLDWYFFKAAMYSNTNFFSKSTIFDKTYALPIIQDAKNVKLNNGDEEIFGIYNSHIFVHIETLRKLDGTEIKSYDMEDPDNLVLSEYWKLTSRDAVRNAAGVIRLFFEEVESEKQTHALRNNKDALLNQASVATVKRVGYVGYLGGRLVSASIMGVGRAGHFASLGVTYPLLGIAWLGEQGRNGVVLALNSLRAPAPVHLATISPFQPIQGLPLDGALLTGSPSQSIQGLPLDTLATNDLAGLIRRLTEARGTLLSMRTATRSDNSIFSNQGEVAGASTVVSPYKYRANSLGGGGGGGRSTTLIFLADASVAVSPVPLEATTTTEIIPIDVTPPEAPIIVSPMENATQGTTSVTISGTAEAGAIVVLSWLAETATVVFETRATTTGAWSADVLLPVGTTTVGAVAIDGSGNVSPLAIRTAVVILPIPEPEAPAEAGVVRQPRILFNEIAWGGTDASPEDEWIEIYNAGNAPADLSRYRLGIGSGLEKVSIPLSGTLNAGAYFVVRSSNLAVIIQGESLDESTLVLPDTGVELALEEITESEDVVRDYIPLCVNWCEKGGIGTSMERFRTELGADDWSNWDANNGNFESGLDRDGNSTYGTPGARNSLNYQLSLTNTILGLQSFARGQGAYIIFSTLTIPAGSSLTLGPGTTVKWVATSQLVVRGALVASGTSDAPVVFTALEDDSAGGDTFADGVTPIVRNTTSGAIALSGASSSALFINTEIRNMATALELRNRASSTLLHATVSDSRNGMLLYASTLTAEDSTFQDIGQNVLSTFDHSTSSLASATIARVGGNVFDIFQSTLSLATTSFTQISRGAIDGFGGVIEATNISIDSVQGSNHAIGLFSRSGTPSVGIFDRVTVSDLGSGEAFYLSLSHATVTDAYVAGSSGNAISLFSGASLAISSSTVTGNGNAAILSFGSTLHADEVTLTDNKYAIYARGGEVVIHDSTITGNDVAGIRNDTPAVGVPIDATENYWGDVDGPTLPGALTGTAGDSVTLGVLVDPFLTTAPQ